MNEYLEQPSAALNVPAVVPDMSDLAEQLVAAAAGQGIDQTGAMTCAVGGPWAAGACGAGAGIVTAVVTTGLLNKISWFD